MRTGLKQDMNNALTAVGWENFTDIVEPAKWLTMDMHPRVDLHLCSLPELQYLYAMAKKIRCSPVRIMLAHWQKMISGKSPIDMTSLVTRIARYVGVVDNAEVVIMK